MLIDQLIRSKRKTVALIVQPDGRLLVRASLRLSLATIQEIVDSKAAWIHTQRARLAASGVTPTRFVTGETFAYLGSRYPLELIPGAGALTLSAGRFRLPVKLQPKAEAAFTAWYIRQARQHIQQRLEALANQHGFKYQRLRISSARTRWGSCSRRGTLSFTWRLIMAPPEVIDYVIIHELAHLRVFNHSPAFWEQVAAMLPGYKTHLAWLKNHGARLRL